MTKRFIFLAGSLCLLAWQLMFLRSAQNAGFEVPQEPIDDAVGYVRRCFRPRFKTFNYEATNTNKCSRAMAGAGVLALAHAGYHNSEEATLVGEWILQHDFDRYNRSNSSKDRYHYSLFNCSQAMYQLGGRYWQEFFPRTVQTLLTNQRPNGSWDAESGFDRYFGNAYTTALVVLALGAPNQLLPVFQR